MPVSDVVRRRGYDIIFTRPGAATIDNGYAIPGSPTTLTVRGTIQPLSGEEIRNLPPGQNSVDWRSVWCTSAVQMRDQLTIDGELFTIQQIDDWAVDGSYFRARAVRVRDQT